MRLSIQEYIVISLFLVLVYLGCSYIALRNSIYLLLLRLKQQCDYIGISIVALCSLHLYVDIRCGFHFLQVNS